MKQLLLILALMSQKCFSQDIYENDSKAYSFTMPSEYKKQPSANQRNEFVFVNKSDTTSLVVNVNEKTFDKREMKAFKDASNEMIELQYFKVLKEPKIVTRGDLDTYKDKTIFFHVRHSVPSEKENNFMLTYLFYNQGKEINFIFRTKEYRLDKVLPQIEQIVMSVKLL